MNRPLLIRAAPLWLIYALAAVLMTFVIGPAARTWSVPKELSNWVALPIIALAGGPTYNLLKARTTDDYETVRGLVPWLSALFVTAAAGLVLVITRTAPPGGGAGLVLGALLLATPWWWVERRVRAKARRRVLHAEKPKYARELIAEAQDRLEHDKTLSPRDRIALTISEASAWITVAIDDDDPEDITIAMSLVEESFEAGAEHDEPTDLDLEAALVYLRAMDVKFERSGDLEGYEEVLQGLMSIAEGRASHDPLARPRAYAARGESRALHARIAARQGRTNEAGVLRMMAALDLQRALAASPPHSEAHDLNALRLALVEGPSPLDGGLDDAIRRCERALRRLWFARVEDRGPGFLALAELLEQRGGRTDLIRALRLYAKVTAGGRFAREARRRIPQLEALAATPRRLGRIAMPSSVRRVRALAREVVLPTDAVSLAEQAAQWAVERGDPEAAADAWRLWSQRVTADLRLRMLDDKVRQLPRIQEQIALAAYWMVKAERPRDAALTLETGRAVLLTERMHRGRPGLAARLEAAGELELADRWRQASERLEHEDRARFGARADRAAPNFASSEYLALTDHDALLRQIASVEGFDDVERPPRYADLRAATADGPLLYLATVTDGAFALLLTAERADPTCVMLEGVDRATVAAHVARLRRASTKQAVARINRDLLPWLWEHVLAPVAPQIPDGSLVTIIAAGQLGELPLHAAGCEAGPDGIWRARSGGLVFRYAPNARVLTRSRRQARRAADASDRRVLSAAVPAKLGFRPLPHALVESDHVAAAFGPDGAERPHPATINTVLDRLERCAVWHFACHGRHDPESPLASRLELADGPLTLATLFARTAGDRCRLAVLSACQTARVDGVMPDEVVGFPSALLQSGVAGVISCQGDVDDAGAMLLVLRFMDGFRRGEEPARALAEAQAWLRSTDNAGFHAAFPGAYRRPHDALDGWEHDRPFGAPSTWALFSYTGA